MTVSSSNIKFTTREGESYDGRLSIPAGEGTFPAVLVMPAIFGTDPEMEELIEAYAADGFLTAAPDYFFRTIPGPTAEWDIARDRMNRHDIDQGLVDMSDAMDELRAHERCNGKVAMLGFCFGGLFAYLAGTRLGADAVVAYHGTRIHSYLEEADHLTVPASLHYGDADQFVPMDQVDPVSAALAGKANAEVVVHSGGQHNFSMPTKAGYDAKVADAARVAALACFRSM
ncbi:dienelactone hydrolase family protein [Alphaproteobacteria bacterium]|nr:dienelactone hydrolase family protein [Alphaproteobacteria bacterium]